MRDLYDNARIVYINDMHEAKEEIRKIGVDASAITWLSPKHCPLQ